MKKIVGGLLVGLLLMVAVPANSQIKFGVRGGINISSVHFSDDIYDKSNITGYHIGPMMEVGIPYTGVAVELAALYSQKGVEAFDKDIKNDYIDIPLSLKWKPGLPIPLIKPYLLAGPYIGFRVGGDKVWNVMSDQLTTKAFNAGLNFGFGAELFNHLQIGLNYGLGLTNNYGIERISLNNPSDKDGKSRGWAVTAAILF